MQSLAKSLEGEVVKMELIHSAKKGGADGAWIKRILKKGASIDIIEQ